MPKFNSAYFQAQILKNQIAVDVAVADNTRNNNAEVAATAKAVNTSNNYTIITATAGTAASRPTAAPANSGAYYVATDTSILSTSNGSSWSTVNNDYVIFSPSSATAYANTAYTTNGSGVLAQYTTTSTRIKTGSTTGRIFDVSDGTGNPVVAVPEGRHFSSAAAPAAALYLVGPGVTDGTFTTITPVEGQSQLSTLGYLYYNSATGKTQWEKVTYTTHVHGGVTAGVSNSSAATA